jgi:uncharacterized protein (DUF1810 family)
MTGDPFDLARFVRAQEPAFATAMAELAAGRKQSHWMWFIFPQLRGLGASPTAQFYGIGSLDEAKAYLAHPVLGPRLTSATCAVLAIRDRALHDIFGFPDELKFVSCMTLFDAASSDPHSDFARALDQFCASTRDRGTLQRLGSVG